jgi:hypothetical protein
MPIAAIVAPLIIGVASVSAAQALPPAPVSSESCAVRAPVVRTVPAAVRRNTESSPAANELSLGTSPRMITRSRKPAVCGTAFAMPSTMIAPAIPLPTSYDASPWACG